jgi:transcriptional regulator with XRE-family HTH domain
MHILTPVSFGAACVLYAIKTWRVNCGLILAFTANSVTGRQNTSLDAYSVTLGNVIRDLRLRAGLSGDAFSGALSRANLYKLESGQAQVRLYTLVQLCEVLGLSPSNVLLIVEARIAGVPLPELAKESAAKLSAAIDSGRLKPISEGEAVKGVKGLQADQTRQAVQQAQASGEGKAEVARKLGLSSRTVDRYWSK